MDRRSSKTLQSLRKTRARQRCRGLDFLIYGFESWSHPVLYGSPFLRDMSCFATAVCGRLAEENPAYVPQINAVVLIRTADPRHGVAVTSTGWT